MRCERVGRLLIADLMTSQRNFMGGIDYQNIVAYQTCPDLDRDVASSVAKWFGRTGEKTAQAVWPTSNMWS